jgi:hypothetical protein
MVCQVAQPETGRSLPPTDFILAATPISGTAGRWNTMAAEPGIHAKSRDWPAAGGY